MHVQIPMTLQGQSLVTGNQKSQGNEPSVIIEGSHGGYRDDSVVKGMFTFSREARLSFHYAHGGY